MIPRVDRARRADSIKAYDDPYLLPVTVSSPTRVRYIPKILDLYMLA